MNTETNRNNAKFIQLLHNMRNRNVTKHDWEYIMKRYKLPQNECVKFNNAVHLMTTNIACKDFNHDKLKLLKTPIAQIKGQCSKKSFEGKPADDFGGLLPVLSIAVGARVMLTRNLCIEKGLMNGAFGTVKAIFYEDDTRPPQLPVAVIVQFDNYIGSSIQPGKDQWVAITPQTGYYNKQSTDAIYRQQIPLKLAWSITIHKSQGLTLDKVVVHFGEKTPFSKGLEFVACSRVKKISDLKVTGVSWERFQKINIADRKRKKEEKRLQRLHDITKAKYGDLLAKIPARLFVPTRRQQYTYQWSDNQDTESSDDEYFIY